MKRTVKNQQKSQNYMQTLQARFCAIMVWFGIDTIINVLWIFYVLKNNLWWWLGLMGTGIVLIVLICDKNLRRYCDRKKQSHFINCFMTLWVITASLSGFFHSPFH